MADQKSTEEVMRPGDLSGLEALGRLLEENRRPDRVARWTKIMFGGLGLLLLLNVVFFLVSPNEHPHFVVDKYPGFWAAFGLISGVVMVFFVKKIVQPLIKRPEDYYGDL